MAKKFPTNPKHPERLCWGCDKYCPADSLICGNGADRTQHPVELFGEDWMDWGPGAPAETTKSTDESDAPVAQPQTAPDADEAQRFSSGQLAPGILAK